MPKASSPAKGDDERMQPWSVVRISADLHDVLRIIASVEKRSMRKLMDDWLGERAEEWCKTNKIRLGFTHKKES
jgi:hypothetical protein